MILKVKRNVTVITSFSSYNKAYERIKENLEFPYIFLQLFSRG